LWAHVTGRWDNLHVPPNCGIVVIEHGSRGYSQPQVLGDVRKAVEPGG